MRHSTRPRSPRRSPSFVVLGLVYVTASCGPAHEPGLDAPTIVLTHRWTVPEGAARFDAVDMGAEPAEVADALMGAVPSAVQRAGEACADTPGWPTTGALVITLSIHEGAAHDVQASPEGPAARCVARALAAETAAFAQAPDAAVLLRAAYSE